MTRYAIHTLLQRTRETKLLAGDLESAIEFATQAYRLALREETPWKELAAYRLAHLLLRNEANSVEDLERILSLLKESETSIEFGLGPLPNIYQIAVLQRLSQMQPESADEYRERQNLAYEAAIETFRSASFFGETRTRAELQSGHFNLLELAAYFANLPYGGLAGLGTEELPTNTCEGAFDYTGSYRLVSHDPQFGAIACTKAFAAAELESLSAKHPDAICFKLDMVNQDTDGSIRSGIDGEWMSINDEQLRILAIEMVYPELPTVEKRQRVQIDICEKRYRKTKERLTKKLSQLTGIPAGETLQFNDPPESLSIFGMVPIKAVDAHRVR